VELSLVPSAGIQKRRAVDPHGPEKQQTEQNDAGKSRKFTKEKPFLKEEEGRGADNDSPTAKAEKGKERKNRVLQ